MKFIFICLFIILQQTVTSEGCSEVKVKNVSDFYYWRDYYGRITPDAFEARTDAEGKPTYIGQSYFSDKNHLLPTIITKGDLEAYIVLGKEKWKATSRTKILCSTNNTLFKWIPTDAIKVRLLTACRQIEVGWTFNILITIGRANHQGRTLTGRVYDSQNLQGLYIHDTSYNDANIKEFEVLVYNCTNPWTEEVEYP